jgi:hypothetical protein
MSVDKYKFVSPGVFVKEIDKSELPSTALDIGPVIIGRTERGPAFRPTMVQSMDEFVQIFGEPIPGGRGGDVWRQGNYSSPTYAGFAARAYLKNNGPVTIVRTLGIQDDEASATSKAQGASGWQVSSPGETLSDGGAYGFFLINSGSTELDDITGSLAAIFYLDGCRIALSGTLISNDGTDTVSDSTASNGVIIESVKDGGLREFKIAIETADGGDDRDDLGTHTLHTFNFDRNSDKYIRKVFNTNPIKTNTSTNDTATQEKYWLGETFDNVALSEVTGDAFGLIMPLENSAGTTEGGDFLAKEATSPETGYFFAQDLIVRPPNADNDFVAANQPELFKFVGLATEGEYLQKNIKISVSNIKAPVDTDVDPYGTFSVEIRDIYDTDSRKNVLERFVREDTKNTTTMQIDQNLYELKCMRTFRMA